MNRQVFLAIASFAVFAALVGNAEAQQRSKSTTVLPVVPPGTLQQGSATAPTTLLIFSDFECPVCARVPAVIKELTATFPNGIRVVFKHSPLAMHANAPLAHEAAMAAAAQGKFWEMHDVLFANQQRLAVEDLTRYARQIGLDVAEFTAALNDHRFKAYVDADLTEAQAIGITSTPTMFINGRRINGLPATTALRNQIELALGLTPSIPVLPVEVRMEDLNLASAPSIGPADAPVTIVEFSDLECPFCRLVLPTVRQVMQAYDGKVRWVFKHYPLDFHEHAQLAHEAALAAGLQGKFWEYHDSVFANQAAMKRDHLIARARELKLDVDKFTADLDSGQFKWLISAEKQEGKRLGLVGTPTFFINGRRLEGNKTFADFKAVIDFALKEAKTLTSAAPVGGGKEEGVRVVKGAAEAPIDVQWFSDFRSPLTPKALQLVNELLAKYPDQIRVTVRHRPVDLRPDGKAAHEGAVAAAAQGKFWEMHDLMTAHTGPVTRETLLEFARRLQLDVQRFGDELDARTHKPVIDRDLAEAQRREVRGTPVFFIQGQRIDGIQPLSFFDRVIVAELAKIKGPATK